MPRSWAPYAILLAQVLIFFRAPLFTASALIPYDLPGYHLLLATHIAESIGGGRFPLWDNFTYCGFPFYANVQTQLFYPPAWPFFGLGAALGTTHMLDLLEWEVALHVWLGGMFAFVLLRRNGTGEAAALLGATAYQLGGFFASQTQHLGVIGAGAWLPLAWAGVLQGSASRLAIGIAMSYLAGYPAAAIVVAISSASVAVLSGRARVLLPALPLAAALAAMQLLPGLELAAWSSAPQRGQYAGTGGGVPLQAFISMVWPNYHHIFEPAAYKLSWNPTYLYLYCGLLPLAAAAAGLLRSRRPRWLTPVLALSLFWMLGETTPVWRLAFPSLPHQVRSMMMPELASMCFLLTVSAAAAFGVRGLPDRLVWAGVFVAWADLTWAGSSRSFNTGSREDYPLVSTEQFEGSADTLRIARSLVNRTTPPARIDIADDSMNWAAAAPVSGIPTATGNDPLCLARIKAVRRLFSQGDPWMHYYTVDKPVSPILDLVNVRYLVAWEQSRAADALPLAAELPGHRLRENTDALPRFFVVGRTQPAVSLEQAIALMKAPEYDPRQVAIVEGAAAATPIDTGAAGTVAVESYGSSRVRLRVTTDRPALLVSSDTFYPGWRAEIDGSPASLILTNAAFRGLAIPPGMHTVTMRFAPRILGFGLAVSACAWIGLLALSRRRTPEPVFAGD